MAKIKLRKFKHKKLKLSKLELKKKLKEALMILFPIILAGITLIPLAFFTKEIVEEVAEEITRKNRIPLFPIHEGPIAIKNEKQRAIKKKILTMVGAVLIMGTIKIIKIVLFPSLSSA